MEKKYRKLLNDAHFASWKRKHPSLDERYFAPKKWSDKSANGLTKAIIAFLTYNNYQAERVSSMGRFIVDKRSHNGGFYIPSTSKNGTADISATIPVVINGLKIGLSVKWEVKIKTDRQSQKQKEYQKEVMQSGGYYFTCGSFDEFLEQFNHLKKKFV